MTCDTNTFVKAVEDWPPFFKCVVISVLVFFATTLALSIAASAQNDSTGTTICCNLALLQLPEKFHVRIYAENLPGVWGLTFTTDGTVFAGSRRSTVYRISDKDKDGVADEVTPVLQDLTAPTGVYYDSTGDSLYIAEQGAILRVANITSSGQPPSSLVEVIVSGLPQVPNLQSAQLTGDFLQRPIRMGYDNRLYVGLSVVCDELPQYCLSTNKSNSDLLGTLIRVSPTNPAPTVDVIARGLRSPGGLVFDPTTHQLMLTDSGRTTSNSDSPPDELNIAPIEGLNFGFPYCYGNNKPDPLFNAHNKVANCEGGNFTEPLQLLGAHVGANGAVVLHSPQLFSREFAGAVFIAERGVSTTHYTNGYRISVVLPYEVPKRRYQVFAAGWVNGDGTVWGRPTDLVQLPDGSLLVSDDLNGVIYRIFLAHPEHAV